MTRMRSPSGFLFTPFQASTRYNNKLLRHQPQLNRFTSTSNQPETSNDGRTRLSQLWIPTGGIAVSGTEDSHAKLVRAGYLRQAHSGIFHMLPLGRRVQDKLETLIDKYMSQLGASKLALSSISSEAIWAKSGRLTATSSELFRLSDRKDGKYILSPTHEEEITSLVADTVKSYKELPLRLYQISRKYRDELRPRQGLLRSREFIMKDLYTFDHNSRLALITYDEVREVYARLFDELKIPYLVADADSGNMGGNLSHEFHFPTSKGEDHIISCDNCKYVANEELAETRIPGVDDALLHQDQELVRPEHIKVWHGISQDRSTLINVWYSSAPNTKISSKKTPEINIHAIKKLAPELDTAVDIGSSGPTNLESASQFHKLNLPTPRQITNLVDHRVAYLIQSSMDSASLHGLQWPRALGICPTDAVSVNVYQDTVTGNQLDLLRIRSGDLCPRCHNGVVDVQKAIELGHTFHLGTRYSEPLQAQVALPLGSVDEMHVQNRESGNGQTLNRQGYMHMGCHGIGVSRMIGAVADTLADEKGLNWPRVMAPFEVVVIGSKGNNNAALEVYDILNSRPGSSCNLPLDLILDDREASFPWKMQDADLVGYPVIVVVGRGWKAERTCEVQCRRLKIRQEIPVGELLGFVDSLLAQL